jgi:hypothetical protein
MDSPARPISRNTLNLLLDTAVFAAFLAATAPRLTGLAIHEWLSLAVAATIVAHLLLHWSWIAGVTARFFGKVSWKSRLNYLLNALLFVAFTAVTFTGVMVSEVAVPLFGVQIERDGLWMAVHRLASDASVFLIGLHVALHWRWIVNLSRKLLGRPGARPRRAAEGVAVPTELSR